MHNEHMKDMRYLERKLKQSRLETAKAHAETVSARKAWMSIVDDCTREANIMGKQIFELTMENARLKEELYAAKVAHMEEKDKIMHLRRE